MDVPFLIILIYLFKHFNINFMKGYPPRIYKLKHEL